MRLIHACASLCPLVLAWQQRRAPRGNMPPTPPAVHCSMRAAQPQSCACCSWPCAGSLQAHWGMGGDQPGQRAHLCCPASRGRCSAGAQQRRLPAAATRRCQPGPSQPRWWQRRTPQQGCIVASDWAGGLGCRSARGGALGTCIGGGRVCSGAWRRRMRHGHSVGAADGPGVGSQRRLGAGGQQGCGAGRGAGPDAAPVSPAGPHWAGCKAAGPLGAARAAPGCAATAQGAPAAVGSLPGSRV